MSVRLLVCLSESASSLSQPGSPLVAMFDGEVAAAQEQVAGRVLGSAHQHQSDLGQAADAMFSVSPELEKQKREECELYSHIRIKRNMWRFSIMAFTKVLFFGS